MSFLTKRKNNLNRFFFEKFQEQVSKAPGYKPILSYEDFLKLVEYSKTLEQNKETTETSNA